MSLNPLSPALPDGIAALPHLGVIRVQGADAASFLHGQLTQDFTLLGESDARLAAFCTAKGRVLATFIGFKRSADEILLITSRDVLPAALKRLSMFVMRAKAKLSDASEEFTLLGLAGPSAVEAADSTAAWQPWKLNASGDARIVTLYPAADVARALWVAPVTAAQPQGPALSTELWLWGEVRSGVATTLAQPVVEAFVPQMLNYESVGGVNFKKGCYPGQEIVARSQFRGTLKRRAFVVHADSEMATGQEVFTAGNADQPAGTVVQVAAAPGGGFDAIVSLQISAAEAGGLQAGSVDGPALTLLPLPYALLEDI